MILVIIGICVVFIMLGIYLESNFRGTGETTTFEKLTPESIITLATVYPELKSNTLVQAKLDVYISNNKAIRELRDADIMADINRWWLYFGGHNE